jgi:Tripartite tricarboxylate transporter family receptor
LIALAKQKPGLPYATGSGLGSPQHMAVQWFAQIAGIKLEQIPYRGGGQAINDLIGGHVKLGSLGSTPLLPHYKAGTLRLLAQTTKERSPSLPEVPTFEEAGIKGLVLDQWLGVFRPFTGADLGRRIRLMWQGAEYRGRGRETLWQGKLRVADNRITRFAPVNFLNPERTVSEIEPGAALVWSSVTTGNLAGIDLWLDQPYTGTINVETNIVSGSVDLAALTEKVVVFDGGGLGRQLKVYRLPEGDWSRRVSVDYEVTFAGGKDLAVYLRVTQADGHQAWSSPIYLID